MYQHGWGRQIKYCIAFSIDDVQDVTWRYTNDHVLTRKFRDLCSENDLLIALTNIRHERQKYLTPYKKLYLLKRSLCDALNFLSIR